MTKCLEEKNLSQIQIKQILQEKLETRIFDIKPI